jgi:fluoride exporter
LISSILTISLGAAFGAVMRWLLSTRLNSLFPALPMGTLAANLIGGYLIGVAISYFALHVELPPQWRLLVITGFLGGLTTFSTFSAEVVTQIQQGNLLWAFAGIAVHVLGSLAMTMLGMATVSALS